MRPTVYANGVVAMAPLKPPVWLDTNILIDIQNGQRAAASAAEKALSRRFENEILNLAKDGHEVLISPRVKFEFLKGARAQSGEKLLTDLRIVEDKMMTQVPRAQVWKWGNEGLNHGLSAFDSDVVAQVRAGGVARGIKNPVLLTRDSGGTLIAMRRRGVQALDFRAPEVRLKVPRNTPTPPEVPPPPAGSVAGEGFWSAAKSGFKAGLKEAFKAENIAAMIPDLVLMVADKVAAREALKNIQVKFIKEGFAKGVAAGVMGWSEEEVASNLMNRITAFRVQGLEDPAGILTRATILQVAEAYENYAVVIGFQFSSAKDLKWKREMVAKGSKILHQYGYYFGTDPQALFEYEFIDKLAWTLQPTTNAIVEPAIRH
ncbi:hypothetical protein [Bradyrhizobium australafricanum]|uniref:hypothetical protein n=1 Tax=Bradyrhizobium australafricanum TaxID=2821406 RepID=UPI001CE3125E|nr:hypothetical protein [Bradyrhizobium australafricanum]